MKISLTRTDIAGAATRKSTTARKPKRLPGEAHEFRDLVPAQYLTPDGTIISSREHEVSRSDPLMQRIRELEAEVAELRNSIKRGTS